MFTLLYLFNYLDMITKLFRFKSYLANVIPLRGLVKLKKIQKSEKNSDYSDTSHPPPYPFFLKHLETWKQQKKNSYMTFGNIITQFPDSQNVILDTKLCFCVHCEPRRDIQLWHLHKFWRPFRFLILSRKKTKWSLAWGRFGISVLKLCKNNCMPNSTKKCVNKSEISKMGPDYFLKPHISEATSV